MQAIQKKGVRWIPFSVKASPAPLFTFFQPRVDDQPIPSSFPFLDALPDDTSRTLPPLIPIERTRAPPSVKIRPRMDRNCTLSKREIEALIAEGCLIVILDGQVLNLDSWIEHHPGGKLPVLHMVGCDASSEISAYHSAITMRRMTAYRIGRIHGRWTNMKPPIRGGVFRKRGQEIVLEPDNDTEDIQAACLVAPCDLEKPIDGTVAERTDGDSTSGRRRPSLNPLMDSVGIQPGPDPPTRDDRISKAMDAEVNICLSVYPSPDTETQSAITAKYAALHQRIKDEGFYTCDYSNYLADIGRCASLFAIFVSLLNAEWFIVSAVFLGFFWHQIMFTAHDAGHRGITHRFVPDTLIGIFVADFCCGLSIGWWKSSHNVHHLVPNSPEHDPDIQNTPLFATCPSQLNETRSTYYEFDFKWDEACKLLVPWQKYTYYPIMAVARFNLYALSWCHLLSPRSRQLGAAAWTRPVELIAMCCYWYLFGYLLVLQTLPDWPTRVAFVLISHMSSMVLHVQITLSHWGMPTCDLGTDESFAQKQLRTTMDVKCPTWLDWFHGGLQFQAIHHLFPRVPRHNLRKLQPLARQFCVETGIPYSIHGFSESNTRVLGRLGEISNQLAMLGQCQDHMAATGESALL